MKTQALMFIAVLAVAACGTTPPSRLYTLGADVSGGERLATEKRRIEITSVRIPELWDRPQIVLTKSATEVSFSEFHRWAAPLKADIPRAVVRDLSYLLGTPSVWLREDFSGTKPDLRVQVTIERIEAIAGESVRLDASWVIRLLDGDAVQIGRAAIVESSAADSSYDTVVAATRRALLAMSTHLAREIAALPRNEIKK